MDWRSADLVGTDIYICFDQVDVNLTNRQILIGFVTEKP